MGCAPSRAPNYPIEDTVDAGPVLDATTGVEHFFDLNGGKVIVGRSGETVVTRATRRADCVTVAVKTLPLEGARARARVESEVRVMRRLARRPHRHVLRLLGAFEERPGAHGSPLARAQLVLEFCAGGDLHDALVRRHGPLGGVEVAAVMRQLLDAVSGRSSLRDAVHTTDRSLLIVARGRSHSSRDAASCVPHHRSRSCMTKRA